MKYTEIMDGVYPNKLRKINIKETHIKNRFLKASIGWIKYKPLLLYIRNKEQYRQEINSMHSKLQIIVPKLNDMFNEKCFSSLIEELEKYDKDVELHYSEYIRTNKIWNNLKFIINNEVN